jgi:multisubunit Na+/H+ antiporter MnhF subunit
MSLFQSLIGALMLVLSLSMAVAVWRLLRGPSIPDRAVAFDLIMIHLVGLIALFALTSGQLVLLDAVIVVAVIGFLGTVALARFIEEGRS